MWHKAKLAAALGLLIAVVPAWAQETYTIKIKNSAKGDVSAETNEEAADVTATVKNADGKVINDVKTKQTETAKFREEILEKEPKHRPTKLRRTYEKAEVSTDGKSMPLPYQGKTVLIEKKDGKYHFMIEGGNEITGDDAKSLKKEFDKPDVDASEMEKAMLPAKAVAANDSWKVDVEAFAKATGTEGEMEIDFAKASGTGKLMKVYKKDGHQFGVMEFQLDLPVKSVGKANQKVTMQAGTKVVATVTLDSCIDGSVSDGHMVAKSQVAGDGTLSVGGMDLKVSMNISGTERHSTQEVKK